MAAWSRKTLKKFKFLRFLEKRSLTGKFSSVPNVFIMTPIDVLCSNFVKSGRREIGKIVRCLPDKSSPWSPALAIVQIAPKIYQGQPPTMRSECSRFHLNPSTFGGVISERVNTVRAHSKVNPIFGWSLASSRIITCFVYTEITFIGYKLGV